jgi:hypothetical protein
VGDHHTFRPCTKQRTPASQISVPAWLSRKGVRVIVDLKDLVQLGVWEVGLLTSFKREVDQRSGVLACATDPHLKGYFKTTGSLASSISTPILKVRMRDNAR